MIFTIPVLLSVIVCTRNPASPCMRRMLESLSEQTLQKTEWELLIVDNASDVNIEATWDLSWHPRGRHTHEDTVGLLPARLRGLQEASGDLIVFVDDDTVLHLDYLERARSISASHPHLGVFGAGTIEPEFEIPPPPELAARTHLLGIRTVRAPVSSDNPDDPSCRPRGGGLCVTSEVAHAYQRLSDRLGVTDVVGRRGRRLFSGDDDLFVWAASEVDKAFGIFPELCVTHVIAANRFTHDYFIRLIHDHTFSHGVLRYLLAGTKPQRLSVWKRLRMLAHYVTNDSFSRRCRDAELRGEAGAAHFIEERQLRPVRTPVQGVSRESGQRRTSGPR